MAARNEDFVILACTVLIQLTSVTDRQTDRRTDGQTDRQTDAQTMAKTREAFCFRALKNIKKKFSYIYASYMRLRRTRGQKRFTSSEVELIGMS